MNIEKFVNSKFYRVFEWFYRLIFINLLILIVSFSLAAIPFLVYYLGNKDGLFVIIGLIIFILLFIPASLTGFLVIKHYLEEQTGNLFVLYFRYLIDTLKRIYIVELLLLPFFFLSIYGLWFYGSYLDSDSFSYDAYGVFAILSFVLVFFLLIFLILVFINIMLIISYFKMKPMHYMRLAFKFSMRYMGQTLIYGLIMFIPFVILNIFVMQFRPIYFIIGISLPQYLIGLITRNKFNYLASNLSK
jgi:uncharacterized membrane protein YesL